MSVTVPLQFLNDVQKKELRKLVTVMPELTYKEKERIRNGKGKVEPLECFKVIGSSVYLPYYLGKMYCSHHMIPIAQYPIATKEVIFFPVLYEWQTPIYDASLEHCRTYGSTLLELPTGSGKTMFGIKASTELGGVPIGPDPLNPAKTKYSCAAIRTIVVITKETYKKQWKEAFAEATTAKIAVLGECKSQELEEADVIIAMMLRVPKLPPHLRRGCLLILDECHEIAVPTGRSIMDIEPTYIIAMSATPMAKYFKFMNLITGNHKIEKAVNKKWTLFRFNTGIIPELKYNNDGSLNWTAFIDSSMANPQYTYLLVEMLKKNLHHKMLILSERKDYCKWLSDALNGYFRSYGYKVDYLTSEKPDYSDSNILIATGGKGGTGFDEKSFCKDWNGIRIDLLFLLIDTRSIRWLIQMFGRTFRSDHPIVCWFVNNHSTCDDHFKEAYRGIVTKQPCKMETISMVTSLCSLWPVEKSTEELEAESNSTEDQYIVNGDTLLL